MITYRLSETETDLFQILDLQQRNLAVNLTPEEIESQGFVTVVHSMHDIVKMNSFEKQVVAVDNHKVIGYLLAMTIHSKNAIPVLIPMFELFEKTTFQNKPISDYNYLVVGQVCIDKNYRGLGVLDKCYQTYKSNFKNKYDFAITEIAASNKRSINAHSRIGFKEINRYFDPENTEWSVVIWDWNN